MATATKSKSKSASRRAIPKAATGATALQLPTMGENLPENGPTSATGGLGGFQPVGRTTNSNMGLAGPDTAAMAALLKQQSDAARASLSQAAATAGGGAAHDNLPAAPSYNGPYMLSADDAVHKARMDSYAEAAARAQINRMADGGVTGIPPTTSGDLISNGLRAMAPPPRTPGTRPPAKTHAKASSKMKSKTATRGRK